MSTKQFYEMHADYFEKMPFENTLPQLFQKYIPEPKGMHVLDVGSGPGVLGLWLKEKGCNVLCIDPSEEMIRRCLYKGLISQHISLQEFKSDEKFDVIAAISSIIHIPRNQWKNQFHHLCLLLKPGGLLFVSVILGDFEGSFDPQGKGVDRFFCFIPESDFFQLVESDFQVLESQKVFVSSMNVEFLIAVLKNKC